MIAAHLNWTAVDIRRLRSGFDTRTLPGTEFNHAAHIAVGATYVCELGAEGALEHLRVAIPRYNVSQGGQNTDTSGYHETLTRFWVERLGEFLRTLPPQSSVEERALAAVGEFSTRVKLFEQYYSFDVVRSLEARRHWIAPDRTPGIGSAGPV
jgi:hypothetical protein